MAFHAGWYGAVLGMMTGGTALLCMGARELRQLTGGAGMTFAALVSQHIIHRNIQRGMRDDMTGHAVEKIRPVRLCVALAAFRHNFIPVVFYRIV